MEFSGFTLFLVGVVIAVIVPVIAALLRYGYVLLENQLSRLAEERKLFELESFGRLFEMFKAELREVVEDAVDALDQIYVKEWKKNAEDGKLTKEEIEQLNKMLIDYINQTLSTRAKNFLEDAVPNLSQLILELAEAYIGFKRESANADALGK